MDISVEEAIKDLQEDIAEKQNQIELIKNIDWDNPVNEETWHEICETPLRSSDLMGVLVKNIFSNAEDITVGSNYVSFNLYGFKCALPTSRCHGVYIETGWYQKDNGQPKLQELFTENQNKLNRMIENHNQTRKEMHEKTKTMVEIVIPELRRFSMKVYKLNSNDWKTPEKIAELEGFELEN